MALCISSLRRDLLAWARHSLAQNDDNSLGRQLAQKGLGESLPVSLRQDKLAWARLSILAPVRTYNSHIFTSQQQYKAFHNSIIAHIEPNPNSFRTVVTTLCIAPFLEFQFSIEEKSFSRGNAILLLIHHNSNWILNPPCFRLTLFFSNFNLPLTHIIFPVNFSLLSSSYSQFPVHNIDSSSTSSQFIKQKNPSIHDVFHVSLLKQHRGPHDASKHLPGIEWRGGHSATTIGSFGQTNEEKGQ